MINLEQYGITVDKVEKSALGVGSDTYFVESVGRKYVVKFPSGNETDNPEAEPELCGYLIAKGIPACKFIKNKDGNYISKDDKGRIFTVTEYIEGDTLQLNTAPKWLMKEMPEMLGRIHTALKEYSTLPEGIGAGFFQFMTPENAKKSYLNSLETAKKLGNTAIVSEIQYRIDLMDRFPDMKIDVSRLTCCNTHGDYCINQIVCRDNHINAVIDWTTACVHPVIWEITRSFVYGAPSCIMGVINEEEFDAYVQEYLRYAPLNDYDMSMLKKLYLYQIAVCDYYGQYFNSEAANREIFLHQARFATKVLQNNCDF